MQFSNIFFVWIEKNFNTALQREATTADLLPSLRSGRSCLHRVSLDIVCTFQYYSSFMKFRNFSTCSVSRFWYHHIHFYFQHCFLLLFLVKFRSLFFEQFCNLNFDFFHLRSSCLSNRVLFGSISFYCSIFLFHSSYYIVFHL